jgi:diguanylate cyclase (GGDEF)-like protein/PAS domain S-box-containing protein
MNNSEPLHLIIADPSQNEAEELVSELRNAGFATRAQHVNSVAALEEALGRQRWDLLVCRRDSEMTYDPAEVVGCVRRADQDLPILLVENGTELDRLTAGLQLGATDVLLEGEEERFMLVLRRELDNLAQRRGRRQAELAMQESERRNQLLLDTSSSAIAYVHEGMHIYVNRAYTELFGYDDADDLAAMPLLDMITEGFHDDFKHRLKQFDLEEASEGFPIEGVRRDGSVFVADMSLSVAAYDGEPCMQVLIRQEAQEGPSAEEIAQLRARDAVTGLFNRPYFIEALEAAVEEAEQGEVASALFQIELDDAGRIRREAGLSGMDDVLRDVGMALAEVCDEDTVLARIGDETFAGLARDLTRDAAAALAERMRAALEDLLASAGERTVRLTGSVGVTLVHEHTAGVQAALDQLQRCIGRLRDSDPPGNGAYVFDPADFAAAKDQSGDASDERSQEILRLLAEGIKTNALVLLFQPIISLRGEAREHYEVYLRLPDADGNLLRPDEFIGLAEQAGMGGRVDRWVVLNAIKRVSQQRAEGRDTRVTINLTHAALTDDSFLPWLRVALKAAKLPKEVVILQYSEQAAETYLKQARAFGEAIAELDCRVGISHFGCSVNPFGTLRHLNVDFVKLDGSILQELDSVPEKQDDLRSMIQDLEGLGKTTVVPMVSTANVLATLFSSGANYVQGNYLGEPTPDMDFEFEGGF